MRNIVATSLLACLSACSPAFAQDLNVREFRRAVDASQVTIADRLPWYAGESVGYTVLARRDDDPVVIPDGSVPVWVVMSSTSAPPYVVSTGTVVSATNGEVRFWLPAPQANLPAGDYLSYATVYQGTNRVGVLDRATVRVSWRPGDDFAAASPLTNVFDQVAGWVADVRADLADASNSLAEAIAAEIYARTNAGYLTAEADAAGLAAAAVAQSNLTAHVEDGENPHGVTAAQLGALTAEVDPGFAAWEPDAHVPVSCGGGFFYPDYFNLSPASYLLGFISNAAPEAYNSVVVQRRISDTEVGYRMVPEIVRQLDFEESVTYSELTNLVLTNAGDDVVAAWADGSTAGTVGSLVATLGDFSRRIEVAYSASPQAPLTNYYWLADATGSFRQVVNSNVEAMAAAAGKSAYVFDDGAYAATNFVRRTNGWAASVDLTCASPWNSAGKNYYAGTLATPQHIVYAAHFAAPTGTVFRWIDATNGTYSRTLVAQRFPGNDLAIGLLDSPLPDAIRPAKIIAASAAGFFRGKSGLRDCPGFRLICLDQNERVWQLASGFMESVNGSAFSTPVGFSGSTNLPFSRPAAIGGDSGNPVFLVAGTNVVLFSVFSTKNTGPFISHLRPTIEAQIAEMGGSVHTNLSAIDLSAFTNFDAGSDMPDY